MGPTQDGSRGDEEGLSNYNILKAELTGCADRLGAEWEVTRKAGTRVTPRLSAVAAGRVNLPLIEKKYERRTWGRKEQFGFTPVKSEIHTRHRKWICKKGPWIKEPEMENKFLAGNQNLGSKDGQMIFKVIEPDGICKQQPVRTRHKGNPSPEHWGSQCLEVD